MTLVELLIVLAILIIVCGGGLALLFGGIGAIDFFRFTPMNGYQAIEAQEGYTNVHLRDGYQFRTDRLGCPDGTSVAYEYTATVMETEEPAYLMVCCSSDFEDNACPVHELSAPIDGIIPLPNAN